MIWFSLSDSASYKCTLNNNKNNKDRYSIGLSYRNTAQHPIYLYPTATGRGLGQEVCSALRHAFSGCSSTSAFTGRGKVLGFRFIKEDESFRSSEALWQAMNTTRGAVAVRTDLVHWCSKCMPGNCSNSKETGADQFDSDCDSDDE